ncbi:MAG: SCP2 sterol-binding domain-containing protein [Solirubrobacterales bacterium]
MSDRIQQLDVEVDPSAVQAEDFARSIGSTPDEKLREGMEGPLRDQIIGEIFSRMEEHFKAGNGQDAVIHWRITGRPDGGEDHWEVLIAEGKCTSSSIPQSEPRATLQIDGVQFLKLVTGNANGPMLFMSGKLKIEGDLMFAAQIQSMFTIPG